MAHDLFGRPVDENVESILIFHDERRHKKDWLYHGLLAIPVESFENIFLKLSLLRVCADYSRILHFCEMTDAKYSNKINLAKEWIRYFKNEFFKSGYLYFFGVCLQNLNYDLFGDSSDRKSQKDFRVYNRFFEMALFSMLRFFFKDYDKITITEIFSHASDRPDEDPFPYHPIYKINKREIDNIQFETDTVIQISSDHENEDQFHRESNFIQFVDCIIGAIGQVLDCSSKKECFIELGELMLPFVQTVIKNPYNKGSCYYKRYILSFFPKKHLNLDEIYSDQRRNMFFYNRELKLTTRNQMDLAF